MSFEGSVGDLQDPIFPAALQSLHLDSVDFTDEWLAAFPMLLPGLTYIDIHLSFGHSRDLPLQAITSLR